MASKRKVLLRNGATPSSTRRRRSFAGTRAIDPGALEPNRVIVYRAAGEWYFACGLCRIMEVAKPGPKAIEAAWVEHVNAMHRR